MDERLSIIRDRVICKVKQQLGTDANDTQRSGSVLYNGWRTLHPGNVYLMGFNPGGNPNRIQMSVIQSLSDEKLEQPTYTAYKEPWEWREIGLPGGNHPHQRRVRDIVRCLCIHDVANVFAANAIFIRSPQQNSLEHTESLWNKCWPVHQLFLSIVQPKIIVCLGNGDKLSAFKLLLGKSHGADVKYGTEEHGYVKYFSCTFDLGEYGSCPDCMVIGVRHPSRFPLSENAKLFLTALSNNQ